MREKCKAGFTLALLSGYCCWTPFFSEAADGLLLFLLVERGESACSVWITVGVVFVQGI